MRKRVIFGLLAAAAAIPVIWRMAGAGKTRAEEPPDAPAEAPAAEQTPSFPLKDKYADYSAGESDPRYLFALETPEGVKEVAVSKTHYEMYYIGDEVACARSGRGWTVV